MLEDDMQVLNARADTLDRSMNMIDGAWEERMRLLAATPGIHPV